MADSEVQRFVAHAKKYGTDQVLESANDAGLNLKQLVQLQEQLDKLPQFQPKPRFWAPAKHKLSVETRVRRRLGLEEEDAA